MDSCVIQILATYPTIDLKKVSISGAAPHIIGVEIIDPFKIKRYHAHSKSHYKIKKLVINTARFPNPIKFDNRSLKTAKKKFVTLIIASKQKNLVDRIYLVEYFLLSSIST